ncbi:Crp/Fnr family transcriptional regulator [Streptomyces sp. WAC 04229]|nr:Crp/Fnr family transcriptional regulator [Streptomyces sp. WAC 04229]
MAGRPRPDADGDRETPVPEPIGSDAWPARSLLGELSPPARRELLELGTEVRFDVGAVLLREGDTHQHVFLLVSGFAKVMATVENGETSLLAVRAAGDTVGEMAAMSGAPRSATVTACGPLTARVWKSGELRGLLERRPAISMALTGMVADRLRWANRRRLDFRGYPAKVRLARLLVELAEFYGSPRADGAVIGCRLTQPELATMVGAAETTIHKVLRDLREEGLLETGYGAITIRHLPELERLAELRTTRAPGARPAAADSTTSDQ